MTGDIWQFFGEVMTFDEQLELITQSQLMDSQWYLNAYPDVSAAGLGAAEHYLRYGAIMRRDPGPDFSTQFYLIRYPDVSSTGLNPLVHYLNFGETEGRDTCP